MLINAGSGYGVPALSATAGPAVLEGCACPGVMVGSIAARAMTGGAPFFPATVGIVVMVTIHWVIPWIGRESSAFSGLVKGHSTLIVKNGKVQSQAMKHSHMSRDDLDEDLREKGVTDPSQVEEARLERSGKLSVIKK
jgi:uncharacterized membrane protein YcaP (DUF421 family)